MEEKRRHVLAALAISAGRQGPRMGFFFPAAAPSVQIWDSCSSMALIPVGKWAYILDLSSRGSLLILPNLIVMTEMVVPTEGSFL